MEEEQGMRWKGRGQEEEVVGGEICEGRSRR